MQTAVQELSDFFRHKAKQGYGAGDQSLTYPRFLDEEDFGPTYTTVSMKEIFQQKIDSRLRLVTPRPVLETAGKALETIGLKEFSYVAEGSSAVCLTSRRKALRVGFRPIGKPRRHERGDVRDFSPVVIQPDHDIRFSKVKVGFEVLPFVLMVPDSGVGEAMEKILPKILDRTCFEMNEGGKDIGVFFDGTPTYVDPGAINLKDYNRPPTQKDFEKIRENCKKLGWPEDLSWVLPDGRFKQEILHPKPQEALDLVL